MKQIKIYIIFYLHTLTAILISPAYASAKTESLPAPVKVRAKAARRND